MQFSNASPSLVPELLHLTEPASSTPGSMASPSAAQCKTRSADGGRLPAAAEAEHRYLVLLDMNGTLCFRSDEPVAAAHGSQKANVDLYVRHKFFYGRKGIVDFVDKLYECGTFHLVSIRPVCSHGPLIDYHSNRTAVSRVGACLRLYKKLTLVRCPVQSNQIEMALCNDGLQSMLMDGEGGRETCRRRTGQHQYMIT